MRVRVFVLVLGARFASAMQFGNRHTKKLSYRPKRNFIYKDDTSRTPPPNSTTPAVADRMHIPIVFNNSSPRFTTRVNSYSKKIPDKSRMAIV
uniref:Uncharacterized protein n=1 Tax=Caenorhabditis japonica TaxID=281687 RepID=A0A8R1II17_CAEJA